MLYVLGYVIVVILVYIAIVLCLRYHRLIAMVLDEDEVAHICFLAVFWPITAIVMAFFGLKYGITILTNKLLLSAEIFLNKHKR